VKATSMAPKAKIKSAKQRIGERGGTEVGQRSGQGLPTVKLRGRARAPASGAEGAQSLSARGANPEALHGPLKRLLAGSSILICPKHRVDPSLITVPAGLEPIQDICVDAE